MRNAELGFDKEHVVSVRLSDELTKSIRENPNTIRLELLKHPDVVAVSQAADAPGERFSLEQMTLVGAGGDQEHMMRIGWSADQDYVAALGLDVTAGRAFSTQAPQDTSAWIINEAAAARFGMIPGEIVGTEMEWNDYRGPIVGVVRDFNFASLHEHVGRGITPPFRVRRVRMGEEYRRDYGRYVH